jgi:hypothetical protein
MRALTLHDVGHTLSFNVFDSEFDEAFIPLFLAVSCVR